MPFKRGVKRAAKAGRRKGTPNKQTSALKEMILQALANVGGAQYLERQAREQPGHFLTLLGRVLPLQVKQDGSEPTVPAPVIHEHHGGVISEGTAALMLSTRPNPYGPPGH